MKRTLALGIVVAIFASVPSAFAAADVNNYLYVTGNTTDLTRVSISQGSSSGFSAARLPGVVVGKSLALSDRSAHVLDIDGKVWGWGSDGSEVGTGDKNAVSNPVRLGIQEKIMKLASGANHTLALSESGNIYVWGWNGHGQLGTGGSEDYSTSWIYNRPTLIALPGGLKAKYIAAGGYQSFAIGTDGSIWGWGINKFLYNLGTGGYSSVYTPTQIRIPSGFSPTKIVTEGSNHTLVLGSDGSVIGWGSNGNGGLGKTGEINAPTSVMPANSGILDIAVNGAATYIVTSAGKVFAAGYNGYGQLGNTQIYGSTSVFTLVSLPANFQTTKVFAASSNAWAVNKSGDTYAWGAGSNDALGTGFTGVINIPERVGSFGGLGTISIVGNYSQSLAIVSNEAQILAKAAADKAAVDKAAADKAAADKAAADKAAADKAAADKAAADKAAADKAAADKAAMDAKAAGELKAKQEAEAKAASKKKITITCIKGKLTKKVTAVNPKCPAGYKVKK